MKHLFPKIAALLAGVLLLTACAADDSSLDPHNPVTLTMWHVYGEQADSPMNRLVDEFNATVGAEQGVLVNVTLMTNSTDIGPKLLAAQKHCRRGRDAGPVFLPHWQRRRAGSGEPCGLDRPVLSRGVCVLCGQFPGGRPDRGAAVRPAGLQIHPHPVRQRQPV